MYYRDNGEGYLLASSQGSDSYAVYDREGNNDILGSFTIDDGNGIDGTQNTDGIDIIGRDLGGQFSEGLLVAQDGDNENDTTNLKFVSLQDLENGVDFIQLGTDEFDPRNPQPIDPDPDPDPDPTTMQATFEQGVNGYIGTVDTFLQEASPNADNSNADTLNVDARDDGGEVQTILRFESIFGNQPEQIAQGAEIISAELELDVSNPGSNIEFHRLLQDFDDTDTYSSFDNGVQANDLEAVSTPDAVTGSVATGVLSVDVTDSLQTWQENPDSNFGWAILPTNNNGVDFDSAEGNNPPRLIVEYAVDNLPNNLTQSSELGDIADTNTLEGFNSLDSDLSNLGNSEINDLNTV
ncbi:hypothetical protein H1P_730001 [Hyella patelloides LEGE 07179]|uniref:BPP domain-containing protein n=2 Tax=Hyella TaxID=945733 RepID=A0A563W3N7_9CYAN|nr:hypothetical protein H1P_730001 [Hyella patelloides LEGE 07179]